MFGFNGESSSSVVDVKSFQKHTTATTETIWNMTPGVPFYLFQWHLACNTKDGAYVDAFSNIFETHDSMVPPPDPRNMTAEQRKKLIVL